MQDASSSKRCPICFILEKKERGHIESIFYEHVNDPIVRKNFRVSQGLCAVHVDLFLKYGDALGLAIFADDLLCQLIESEESKFERSHCLLCQEKAPTEARLVEAFFDYLKLDEFWQALECSVGLCLRHWRLLDQFAPDKKLKSRLLDFQKQKLVQHQELLASFIEKNNFTVPHDEITAAEAQSYQLVWSLLMR
jgi:hypothetical protein